MNKECDEKLNNALKGLSKIATPITDDEKNSQSTFRDGLMEDILKDNNTSKAASYSKKIIMPDKEEMEKHKQFLSKELKKNYY